MRPGHNNNNNNNNNNKRMRGRGRKGPNPLSRSYESNGPDVKVRGTAQHIAERYTTLARDATSAGDRVMAENYFQHAEHYGRIVAAAQGSFQPAQIERDYDGDEDENEDGGDFAPAQDGRNNNGNVVGNSGQNHGQNNGQNGSGSYRDNRENRDRSDNRGDNRDRRDRDFRGERQDRDGREPRAENNRDNNRDRDNRDGRDRNFRDRDRQNGGQAYGRDENSNGERGPRRPDPRDDQREDERGETAPVGAQPHDDAAEAQPQSSFDAAPRRRGRPPRPRYGESAEQTANAELPSTVTESPASVSADSDAASDVSGEPAPRRRGRPPRSASVSDETVPVAADEAGAEAPVKRRPGRPRKVRPEEGSDERNDLPAFLLATND